MRIAIVCPYSLRRAGGVQQQVFGEANFLAEKNYEVLLIAPDIERQSGAILGCRVKTLDMGRSFRIYGNGSAIPLSFPLLSLSKIASAIDSCDVVHFHEPFYPFTTLLLRKINIPAVATFHAARLQHPFYRFLRPLLLPYYEKLQVRIAVSPLAAETVLNHFPPPLKIIPNAIPLPRRKNTQRKNKSPYLLFVGRDEKRKGLAILLEAHRLLQKDFPQLRLKLAGSDGKTAIGPLIDNAGFVSEQEKDALIAGATVFCAPALFGESFGVILLEAMARGAPVVASQIRGYDTILDDNKNGLMFEAGNAPALAETIRRLLSDRKLQKKLVSNGLRTARAHAWPEIGTEYLKIFSALVNKT